MTYLEYFDGLLKNAVGTPTGLKNDYSGVLYLVNNQGRRSQAELCLAREVADPGSGKGSILPPDIQTYKTGLFYLAGELLYGNFPRENLALYTEEGLDFLLYEILWGMSKPDSKYADPADYPEEKHKVRNLASDFKKFIALVNEQKKTVQLEGIEKEGKFGGIPYEKLFAAHRLYNERVEAFKKDKKDACFFSPLEAYRELLAALQSKAPLKVKPEEFLKTRVIAVEDLADMEPLFRTLIQCLDAAGYKVVQTESRALRPPVHGGLDLKGFITSLDEAEYVGWSIKKLLTEKTAKEGEISAACFSRETAALLPLVFTRYGLQAASAAPAASSHLFQAYSAAARIALDLEPQAADYLELFSSTVSAFRLEKSRLNKEVPRTDRKTLRQLIQEAGYKASVNRENPQPAYWVGKVLTSPEVSVLLTEEERGRVKNLLALSGLPKETIFSDLLAITIDMSSCSDTGLAKTLGRMANRADKAIQSCLTDKKELGLLASSLLALMAETEYSPRGKAGADTFLVPVLTPERMLNTSASHIFACGLTGEADKLKKMPIPEKLAEALGLTGKDEKGRPLTYPELQRKLVYDKFESLAAAGREGKMNVTLTYGYNNIGGDMAGMSNLVRAVKKFYSLSDNKGGDIPSLYAAHELMLAGGGKAPDASYASTAGPAPDVKAKIEEQPAELPKDLAARVGDLDLLTILRLRELKKARKDPAPLGKDGLPLKVSIGVRDFAGFMNCPRKFITKIFLEAAGIQEERDHESQIPLNKGNFWHAVYEKAGALPDFYSADKEKILAAVWTAFEGLLKTASRDPETFQDMPLEEFKAESRRVFELFAANEAARQGSMSGLKAFKNELTCEMSAGKIPLGAEPGCEEVELLISGRIDRIDWREEGGKTLLHVWDYKTGYAKPKLVWTGKEAFFGQDSETALQLAIYVLMLSADTKRWELPEGLDLKQITGANIFIDGTTNIGADSALNAKNINFMAETIKGKVLSSFRGFFAKEKISAMDEDYTSVAQRELGKSEQAYNPKCSQYCSPHLCKFISLAGLKGGRNA